MSGEETWPENDSLQREPGKQTALRENQNKSLIANIHVKVHITTNLRQMCTVVSNSRTRRLSCKI